MPLPNAASFENYGGEKDDFSPVTDPDFDRSAEEMNLALADTAAMTRTITRAYLQFTGDTAPGAIIPDIHQAVWGSAVAVAPTLTNTGGSAGIVTVEFPALIDDALAVERSVNLIAGWGAVEGSTLAHVSVTKTSPNIFTVYLFDASGTASDLSAYVINLFFV